MTILFQLQLGLGSYGFKEKRLVYMAPRDREDEGEEKPEKAKEQTEAEKKAKADVDDIKKQAHDKVDGVFLWSVERQRETVDRFIAELPVDIDPESISKAKEDLDEGFGEKKIFFDATKKEIQDFAAASGKTPDEAAKFEDSIGIAFYKTIPQLSLQKIRENKNAPGFGTAEEYLNPVKAAVLSACKKHAKEGEKIDTNSINELAQKLSRFVPQLLENQVKVISRIDEIKQAIIKINDNLRRKQTEKRLIEDAEKYLGFPLKEGTLLEGIAIKPGQVTETGAETIKKYKKTWRVMDPIVNKAVQSEGDPKLILQNLAIQLHDTANGDVTSLSLNNMKEFIFTHDISPVVRNQNSLAEAVPYLEKFGINLSPGMEIEFDTLARDEASNLVSQANKIKILSIDDKGVKLDKQVLYRAMWDSPDLAQDEYMDEMTLGEFAKWLNIRRPLPTVDTETLRNKMNDHYEYLNKEYSRVKECHRPIELKVGEIIYAEAPGNPMYEITEVEDNFIEISVGPSKKKFTNTQFLRWIYENDLEPFDPNLQALRAKTYLGYSSRKANKVLKDCEDAIKLFKEKGIWRNSFEELKKQGAENLVPDKVPDIKTIEPLDAYQRSESALAAFWRNTKILRIDDIFQILKKYYEFYAHNWERSQKERYSSIGKGMPFYGSDFARLNQEAETEEVEKLKKDMKDWSPPMIYDAIFKARNKDHLKACIELLCEKGKFRWDDPKVWEMINKFNDADHQVPLPDPPDADPYRPYRAGTGKQFAGRPIDGKTGFDFLPEAVDALWGESTYTGWKRGNDSTHEDGCNKAFAKGKELEADPSGTGGVANELAVLLEKHMNGAYIEPSDYEGLLRFILKAGKAGGDDKLYYLLMGLTIPNPETGKTIMSWDRLSYFIDEFGNTFPGIDYFTDKDEKRLPETGEIYKGSWRKAHFEHLTRDWAKLAKENHNYKPPTSVSEYLNKEILTANETQIRLEKAIGKGAQNIDHDDYPFYGPALKENAIENLCAFQSGGTQKISTQAYKNIYVGFAPRMQALIKKIEEEKEYEKRGLRGTKDQSAEYFKKLTATLTSFMRFDSILGSRYKRDENYVRLGRQDYDTPFNWDQQNNLSLYKQDLQGVVKEIIDTYNPENKAKLLMAFEDPPSTLLEPAQKRKQKEIEAAVEEFGKYFEQMVTADNGAKMMEIIEKHDFLKPGAGSAEERKKARAQQSSQETAGNE
ncbi:hypothetical protein JW911_03880 [Candidatus Peregrinibacteria bacterium]|nr:hypothetical protein [Candidatus Peregrinibacteria bacterium]